MEKYVKSIVEKVLEQRLSHYMERIGLKTKGEEIGKVNVVGLAKESELKFTSELEDRRLFEEDIYLGGQSEDSLGYLGTIVAHVFPTDNPSKGKFEIVDERGNLKKKDLYKNRIETLLLSDGIDISKDIVKLEIRLYNDDETIVPAGYLAVRSAKRGERLRQNVAICVGLLSEGKTIPVDNLNARLYGVSEQIDTVLVTSSDYEKRIKKEWYPTLRFEVADTKEQLVKKILA